MTDISEEAIILPHVFGENKEVHIEHPEEVTEEEAEEGLVTYREVDDLDDDSNGMES